MHLSSSLNEVMRGARFFICGKFGKASKQAMKAELIQPKPNTTTLGKVLPPAGLLRLVKERATAKAATQYHAKKGHTGIMLAFYVPFAQANIIYKYCRDVAKIPEKLITPPEEMHLTLNYVGDSTELVKVLTRTPVEYQEIFQDGITDRSPRIYGTTGGVVVFDAGKPENGGKRPIALIFNSPKLPEFRQKVYDLCREIGLYDSERPPLYGFVPHITLMYQVSDQPIPKALFDMPPVAMEFAELTLSWGDTDFDMPLKNEKPPRIEYVEVSRLDVDAVPATENYNPFQYYGSKERKTALDNLLLTTLKHLPGQHNQLDHRGILNNRVSKIANRVGRNNGNKKDKTELADIKKRLAEKVLNRSNSNLQERRAALRVLPKDERVQYYKKPERSSKPKAETAVSDSKFDPPKNLPDPRKERIGEIDDAIKATDRTLESIGVEQRRLQEALAPLRSKRNAKDVALRNDLDSQLNQINRTMSALKDEKAKLTNEKRDVEKQLDREEAEKVAPGEKYNRGEKKLIEEAEKVAAAIEKDDANDYVNDGRQFRLSDNLNKLRKALAGQGDFVSDNARVRPEVLQELIDRLEKFHRPAEVPLAPDWYNATPKQREYARKLISDVNKSLAANGHEVQFDADELADKYLIDDIKDVMQQAFGGRRVLFTDSRPKKANVSGVLPSANVKKIPKTLSELTDGRLPDINRLTAPFLADDFDRSPKAKDNHKKLRDAIRELNTHIATAESYGEQFPESERKKLIDARNALRAKVPVIGWGENKAASFVSGYKPSDRQLDYAKKILDDIKRNLKANGWSENAEKIDLAKATKLYSIDQLLAAKTNAENGTLVRLDDAKIPDSELAQKEALKEFGARPPAYKKVAPDAPKRCGTCEHLAYPKGGAGYCTAYALKVSQRAVCKDWKADTDKSANPGANQSRKETLAALITESLKASASDPTKIQNPGARGGKGYFDDNGVWRYGKKPAKQAGSQFVATDDPTTGRKKTGQEVAAEVTALQKQENLDNVLGQLFQSDVGILEALTFIGDDPTSNVNDEYKNKLIRGGFATFDDDMGEWKLTAEAKTMIKAAADGNMPAAFAAFQRAGKRGAVNQGKRDEKDATARERAQKKADAAKRRADRKAAQEAKKRNREEANRLSAERKAQIKKMEGKGKKEATDYATGTGELTVVKEAKTGRYRWLVVSSLACEDRDKQVLSAASLKQAVDHMDATNDYGVLRWWHVPGLDLGKCDTSFMFGRSLIESGTFYSNEFAESIKAACERPNNPLRLKVSVGFRHPITEPDAEGVFHNVKFFERSLLPDWAASNQFTGFAMAA